MTAETWFIDRYKVIEQIGTGAMGIVYRVHDPRFSGDRALKILRKELIGDADIVARFKEEGRSANKAAGEVTHPNIVTVYDVGKFEDRPFIVMELFKGIPLKDLMDRGDRLTLQQTLSVGIQLASALNSAHSHGVVHRDIKPGNILITENLALAKITDFSVAQVKKGQDQSVTRTGVVIGAPRYMPPEQAMGGKVDGRSDLYALGVVLYELLTGEKAYKSDTFTALLIEITQSDPKPIRSIRKDVPPGIERIVTKLLAKKPERRFQDGKELETAIRREMRNLNAQELRSKRGFPAEIIGAIALGILVAGLMGLTGYQLRKQQVKALQDQTAALGTSYAETLANRISMDYALNGDDISILYEAQFRKDLDNTNLDYQHLVLTNGNMLASTSEERGTYFTSPEVLTNLQGGEEGSELRVDIVQNIDGDDTLQVAKSVGIGLGENRRPVATFYVGLPTEPIQKMSGLITSFMLAMSGLVSSLIALISYFLIRRYSKPMERLRDNLVALANGDHDVRMTATQKGLIGQTFSAFNKAAEAASALPEEVERLDPIPEGSLTGSERPGARKKAEVMIVEPPKVPLKKTNIPKTDLKSASQAKDSFLKPSKGKTKKPVSVKSEVKKSEVKKPETKKPDNKKTSSKAPEVKKSPPSAADVKKAVSPKPVDNKSVKAKPATELKATSKTSTAKEAVAPKTKSSVPSSKPSPEPVDLDATRIVPARPDPMKVAPKTDAKVPPKKAPPKPKVDVEKPVKISNVKPEDLDATRVVQAPKKPDIDLSDIIDDDKTMIFRPKKDV